MRCWDATEQQEASQCCVSSERDSKIRAIAREEGIEYEQLNAREKELLLLGVPPEQRSENRDEREAVMSKILSESAQYLYRMRQERLAHSA